MLTVIERSRTLSPREILLVKTKYCYSETVLAECREWFLKLRDEGTILNDAFEDACWMLKSKKNKTTGLRLDVGLIDGVENPLKAFAILQIRQQQTPPGIQAKLRAIRECILRLYPFTQNRFDEFNEWVLSQPRSTVSTIKMSAKSFFEFYSTPMNAEYLHYCGALCHHTSKIRNLPNFTSIILFDALLKFFFSRADQHSPTERKFFYPILLWWTLTTQIPLRPSEFIALKRNCFYHTDNGQCRIKLPRAKNEKKNVPDELEILDDLQIAPEVYELFREYVEISEDDDSGLLFSYKIFGDYYGEKNLSRFNATKNVVNEFNYGALDKLLETFYTDIIKGRYGFTPVRKNESVPETVAIEIICLNDTRHFAFLNMMLQGFSELSIARIGGHAKIESQIWYHSHLTTFAQSSVYVMAKMLGFITRHQGHSENLNDDVNRIYTRSLLKSHDNKLRRVPLGWCSDPNFPNCCADENCVCEFLMLDFTQPGIKENLVAQSQTLDSKLTQQLSAMLELRKRLRPRSGDEEKWRLYQEEVLGIGQTIGRTIARKAEVDRRVMEVEHNERRI